MRKKKKLCTCITLFCKFLARPCTTTTWNDQIWSLLGNGNGKAINSTISVRIRARSLLFSSKLNSLLLSNWAPWNNREKKWKDAKSIFRRRFHGRRRCRIVRSILAHRRAHSNDPRDGTSLVPRALFPGFGESHGKAPWGRGWDGTHFGSNPFLVSKVANCSRASPRSSAAPRQNGQLRRLGRNLLNKPPVSLAFSRVLKFHIMEKSPTVPRSL